VKTNNGLTYLGDAQKKAIATKVSWIGIAGNVFLMLFKLFAGIVAHSGAMVSDGIHSAADVLSVFVVLVSVKLSHKAADKEHPYGHERIECVASLILAFFLFTVGVGIGVSGFKKILISSSQIVVPGLLALIAAGVSAITKEVLYLYTISKAKEIDSSVLKASAMDHISDVYASIGAFIGILGARHGYLKLDAVASVAICLFILKTAIDIFKDAVNRMIDRSCSAEFISEIKEAIAAEPDVINVDDVKTRMFGDRVYIDVEIAVDGRKALTDAHLVANSTHDMIEKSFPQVKHCMVHVNPSVQKT